MLLVEVGSRRMRMIDSFPKVEKARAPMTKTAKRGFPPASSLTVNSA